MSRAPGPLARAISDQIIAGLARGDSRQVPDPATIALLVPRPQRRHGRAALLVAGVLLALALGVLVYTTGEVLRP